MNQASSPKTASSKTFVKAATFFCSEPLPARTSLRERTLPLESVQNCP